MFRSVYFGGGVGRSPRSAGAPCFPCDESFWCSDGVDFLIFLGNDIGGFVFSFAQVNDTL